jgi:hypothetical protein
MWDNALPYGAELINIPIVTYLGRIDRSEERSDVSGYDDRRSFRCSGMLVRRDLMKRGG